MEMFRSKGNSFQNQLILTPLPFSSSSSSYNPTSSSHSCKRSSPYSTISKLNVKRIIQWCVAETNWKVLLLVYLQIL